MGEKRQVYLDYSATTPVKKEVAAAMLPYFTEHFGNPSSLYTFGQEAKTALRTAKEQVAGLVGAQASEIYFTGSGTEADNWAVVGGAMWKRGKGRHVITTEIEHHAVLHSAEYLAKEGFEVTYLPVGADGLVRAEDLKGALREDTTIVSVMFANNEIGTVQPIAELCRIAHDAGALFHTDAVQAAGSLPIDVGALGVDMMSLSAHKIYGPKGVGALYIKKGVNLPTYIHGGAQESGKRAGTENVAGIVGFGKAAELAGQDFETRTKKIAGLRDYLVERVQGEIPDIRINGCLEARLPGNINITFKYIEGEAIMLLLDMAGVSVSTGSACTSASLAPSHVLKAIGVPVDEIHGSIRMTVGDFTVKEDVDYAVDTLKAAVEKLRSISALNGR
ncbi:MAG: cysteine desulfurase NifS [Clostridiales bacterium]|nr:cysteine desulfurase NifS [Clostridiales bacterium]